MTSVIQYCEVKCVIISSLWTEYFKMSVVQ
jgi:hypothetical protein